MKKLSTRDFVNSFDKITCVGVTDVSIVSVSGYKNGTFKKLSCKYKFKAVALAVSKQIKDVFGL